MAFLLSEESLVTGLPVDRRLDAVWRVFGQVQGRKIIWTNYPKIIQAIWTTK